MLKRLTKTNIFLILLLAVSVYISGIAEANNAPVVSTTIPDQTVHVGGSSITISIGSYFSDPDGDALIIAQVAVDSGPGPSEKLRTVTSLTSVELKPIAAGTATVRITVKDPGGLTAEQSFGVKINQAPAASGTIPGSTIEVGGTGYSVNVSNYFTDANNDTLTYTAASSDTAIATVSVSESTVTVTGVAAGSPTITVTATDTSNTTATQTFSVTVKYKGTPTAVGTIANQNMNRDFDPITVDVSSNFSDPDGDTLTYTATSSDTTKVTVSVSSATLTLTQLATGTVTITVTATDPGGLSVNQTFSVTVSQPTQPRTVGSIPNHTLKIGKTLVIEARQYFNDPDGSFRYTNSVSSSGPTVGSSISGTLATYNAVGGTGNVTATIIASGKGPTLPVPHAIQTFTITIVQANRAPSTVGTISDQSLILGTSSDPTIDVSSYFSDADGDTLTYTATSSDTAAVTVSLSDTTLTVTPVAAGGTTTITVTATDTSSTTATQTFSVGVKGPPVTVGTIPLQKLEVGGASISFHVFDLYFDEPDGNMTGSGMSHPNTAVATIGINPFNNHLLTINPVGKGTDSVRITMIDPEGTATQQLNVRVYSGPVPNGTIPNVSVNVGGSSTDVDVSAYFDASTGNTLTYTAVSSDTGKATVSISDATLTVTPVAAGTATITARAIDSSGKSATQTFTATVVQPNQSPVAVGTIPSDQSIKIGGAAITIDVKPYFSDPDGDALTYHLWRTSGSGSIIFSFVDGVLTVNTNGYQTGTPQFRAVARDPDSAWAEQRFSITVKPANRAPTANGTIPNSTKKIGHSAYSVDLSSYFTDADEDTLTYLAVSSDTSKATVSLSDATLSVTPVAVGTATITTTATDPNGTFATQIFTITVKQANRAPVASTTIPDQTIERTYSGSNLKTNVHIGLSDKFSDADGDALTYTATVAITSAGYFVHVDFRMGASTLTITAPQADVGGSGTTTVTVTATDTDSESVSQTFSVTTSRRPTTVGAITEPFSVTRGGTSTLTNVPSYFSDPDGDTLTYSASSSDTNQMNVSVSGNNQTLSLSGTTHANVTITLTATDPIGLTASRSFNAIVGSPPTTVGTISNISARVGWGAVNVNVSSYFNEPDGDALTYSASSSNTSIASVDVSGSTVSVTANNGGDARITVKATDPGGSSATQTFTASVPNYFIGEADAIPGLSSAEQRLLGQLLTYDTLIFNELYNSSNDTNDWLELRNVSNVDIPLDNWKLTIQTGGGSVIIPFPTGTAIPTGEVLLLKNTAMASTDAAHIVIDSFALPQSDFALILRSPTAFGDLAGNYFQDASQRPETAPEFALGIVYDRVQTTVSGYRAEAWAMSTYRNGLGSPGYQPSVLVGDVNNDGVVNILDLVMVASKFGTTGHTAADLNGDNTVNIQDLVLVANALNDISAAPTPNQSAAAVVNNWLKLARQNEANLVATSIPEGFSYQRGIEVLEQLVRALTPDTTALLANYPNPFNPETWIPYQLAKAADVTVTIYASDGNVVRTLAIGHRDAGMYKTRSQAVYWDGKNAFGESVASGVYFYTLTAGDFSATRKMLILK